jgi:hypothetical protein
MISLLAIALVATVPTWQAWRFGLPVSSKVARETYVRLRLPAAVDPGPGGSFADLRVIDDKGTEVAYALDPQTPSPAGGERSLPTSDVGFVNHRYTEATLDMGISGDLHGAIRLETKESPFFVPVEIASSDDRHTWRVLRKDALMYRVSEGGTEDTVVHYPHSRARWLRVRILEPRQAFDVDGATLAGADKVESGEIARLPITAAPQAFDDQSQQIWTFDTGGTNIGAVAVAFDATQATFERSVAIEASEDGATWYALEAGAISRFLNGEPSVRIPFPETYARKFRVIVSNRDDQPVTGLVPHLYGREHFLVFRAEPGRRYRLLWGNPSAAVPEYDLSAQLGHDDWQALDAQAETEGSRHGENPRASLVSGSLLFSGALLACCLVLGALTIRALRG